MRRRELCTGAPGVQSPEVDAPDKASLYVRKLRPRLDPSGQAPRHPIVSSIQRSSRWGQVFYYHRKVDMVCKC